MNRTIRNSSTVLGVLLAGVALPALAQEGLPEEDTLVLDTIVVSAEEQIRQALGVSQITEGDLEKQPIRNDISEIVRKMPGVNLTGATATGQRGNQRQIDIRGMGPENTLILVDGKPVLSRNSVKMSRGGERDTRGDSNWVPAEMIERIEVIRGPAAARYGSGASGGVVNIITKRPEEFTAQVSSYIDVPESSEEGNTGRTNLMLAGPLGERLSYRLYANYAKTQADSPYINPDPDPYFDDEEGEIVDDNPLAGSEGVENKDLGALLTWEVSPGQEIDFEASFSRQGNDFACDTRSGETDCEPLTLLDGSELELEGAETSRMYRRTLAITHRGEFDFGESNSFIQYERTDNTRLCAGTAGGGEDNYTECIDTDGDDEGDATAFSTIELENVSAKTEWIVPVSLWGKASRVTFGADYRGEFMDDAVSIRGGLDEGLSGNLGVPAEGEDRDPTTKQNTIGLYSEANVEWNEKLTLTPGLRYDYNDNFGNNLSPYLNATYDFTDEWSMKVGIARVFKAPNLYQLNPNYVYVTMGMGCPFVDGEQLSGPCYVLGNPDLEPEKSLNKEIGFSYAGYNDINGSLTYFHNDYDNKIGSGFFQYNPGVVENRLFRWENEGDAVVSGLEGNFATPLGELFAFNANFTYMIESEKDDGQPLSLVPDYTINAWLDWYVTSSVTATLSATHYGEIEAASINSTTGEEFEETTSRDPYTLVNLGGVWQINDNTYLSTGVTNILDKSILRTDSGGGANTFNEPGRAYYLSMSATF